MLICAGSVSCGSWSFKRALKRYLSSEMIIIIATEEITKVIVEMVTCILAWGSCDNLELAVKIYPKSQLTSIPKPPPTIGRLVRKPNNIVSGITGSTTTFAIGATILNIPNWSSNKGNVATVAANVDITYDFILTISGIFSVNNSKSGKTYTMPIVAKKDNWNPASQYKIRGLTKIIKEPAPRRAGVME